MNTQNRSLIVLAIAGLAMGMFAFTAGTADAATITYDFESQDNTAATTGTGFSVNDLQETGVTATYGHMTGTSDTTVVRGFRADRVDNTLPAPSTSPDYLDFTITPDAGFTLDFSAATFDMTIGSWIPTTATGPLEFGTAVFYQINGGTLTAVGSTSSVTNVDTNTTGWTETLSNFSLPPGQTALPTTGGLVEASITQIDLSAITGLNADDTVTIRIALGDNSGNKHKHDYVDDLVLNGFTSVPEPGSLALQSLGLLGLIGFGRRKRR